MPYSGRSHRDPLMRKARKGRPYRRLRAQVFAEDPDICITCGHPGTDQMGHKIPLTLAPHLGLARSNVGRQHGTQPCPTCHVRCNQVEGNGQQQTRSGPKPKRRSNGFATSEPW